MRRLLLRDIPPRSYEDTTVPLRADGSSLTRLEDLVDYYDYVRWLGEYLYTADLPLSEEQLAWINVAALDAEQIFFACSEELGIAIWDLEDLEASFDRGETWHQYSAHFCAHWMLESESDCTGSFEEWLDMDEPLYERFRREWEAEQERVGHDHHMDIGFRPLLALAIRQIHDQEARYKKLDWFFTNLSELAAK